MSVVRPTYSLALIKGLVSDGSWVLTVTAENDAMALGLDQDDIRDCICNHLNESHFYKTMPSEKNPNLMQDVYHITYDDHPLYVKLQVNVHAVVISFKER